MKKIPNVTALRDFLGNKCKKYLPCKRDMSTGFARDVLSGHKKLLNLSDVLWISEIPTYHELSVKKVWEELSKDSTITCYFPDYSPSRYPEKKYLMNVINTVKPG